MAIGSYRMENHLHQHVRPTLSVKEQLNVFRLCICKSGEFSTTEYSRKICISEDMDIIFCPKIMVRT